MFIFGELVVFFFVKMKLKWCVWYLIKRWNGEIYVYYVEICFINLFKVIEFLIDWRYIYFIIFFIIKDYMGGKIVSLVFDNVIIYLCVYMYIIII